MSDRTDINPGHYSYRFRGFAMQPLYRNPWYLVGMGTIDLTEGAAKNGLHSSTIHRHNSSASEFTYSTFSVNGNYKWDAKTGTWHSDLTFTQLTRSRGTTLQVLHGRFSIVRADEADKYWLISTGGILHSGQMRAPTSEVVEGEIIRIGDLANT